MGKIFLPSEKWDKNERDLPMLTYKDGKINISRTFSHLKKPSSTYSENRMDLPIFSIDEEGKPIIEKNMLENLPDIEQSSFSRGRDYEVPTNLVGYLSKVMNESMARLIERPKRLYNFFKEKAKNHGNEVRLTSWRERVVSEGLSPYKKYDSKK
jgi:hypothetical protein